MKKIFLIFALFPLLFSCEDKETEDISTVTPVPHMEVLGDDPMVVIKGAGFEDPGIYAEEYTAAGDTIPDLEYERLNDVDSDVPGSYKVTYMVENAEDVPFYVNRTVNVVDITGYDVFELPTGSYSGYRAGYGHVADGITVEKLTTGIYSVSDLLAGFYEQYFGYGPAYSAPGIFVINQNGVVRSELGFVDGWKSDVTTSNIQFDPETNTISYTVTLVFANFSFDVWLELD